MNNINFGAKIPLELALNTEESDKYIVASLVDLQTGDLIQDDIVLNHLSNGVYSNFDISMPSVLFIKAIALVFENDEITPSYTTPQKYEQVFSLNVSKSDGKTLIGKIIKNPLIGKIKSIEKLNGKIKSIQVLSGKINDLKLIGKIKPIEKLIGKIN